MSNDTTPDHNVNKNLNQSTSEDTPSETPYDVCADESVHEKKYVKVLNEFVDNPNISIQAKWLLVYLLRQSPTWVFYRSVILKHMGYGREKVEQLFSELVKAGYVKYTLVFDEKGKITGKKRHFAREPIFLDEVNSRDTGFPCQGKPVHNKKTMTNAKKTNNNNKPSPARAASLSESNKVSKHPIPTREMIVEIYEYWKIKMGLPRHTLTPKRAARIEFGLKRYGLDGCKKAIDGCRGNEFNMKNKHNDIELILRDESKADRYISLANDDQANLTQVLPLGNNYV